MRSSLTGQLINWKATDMNLLRLPLLPHLQEAYSAISYSLQARSASPSTGRLSSTPGEHSPQGSPRADALRHDEYWNEHWELVGIELA